MTEAKGESKTKAVKPQDSLVEVVLVDPLTLPIAKGLAKTGVSPAALTVLAFLSRMGGAAAIALGRPFLSGGLVFLGLLLDGLDGKVARLQSNRVRFHGMLDFVLDQAAFASLPVAIVYYGWRQHDLSLTLAAAAWLGAYLFLMALTSTWFRLLADAGMTTKPGIGTKAFLDSGAAKGAAGSLAKWRARARSSRIMPYPTTIEASFLAFIVAPFTGDYHAVVVWVGAAMFVPEVFLQSMRMVFLERSLPA